jgi:hypothetical protein
MKQSLPKIEQSWEEIASRLQIDGYPLVIEALAAIGDVEDRQDDYKWRASIDEIGYRDGFTIAEAVMDVYELVKDWEAKPKTDNKQRLTSYNEVRLYDGLVKDLGLHPGDLVIFVKNDNGHWEIRTEQEITQEINEIDKKFNTYQEK